MICNQFLLSLLSVNFSVIDLNFFSHLGQIVTEEQCYFSEIIANLFSLNIFKIDQN